MGQGIVSAIGSADSHMDVLEMPAQISSGAMAHGLDANTAFSIISIDIADIEIGENIGRRLQADQADADARVARTRPKCIAPDAVAQKQQMIAKAKLAQAEYVLAEAQVPAALAEAFRAGRLRSKPSRRVQRRDPKRFEGHDDDPTTQRPAKHGDIGGSSGSPFPRVKDEHD